MPSVYSPRWTEPEETVRRLCDMPGCECVGEYKAPKDRASASRKDWHWFCLDHVKQYNQQWNYFSGMSDLEAELYWQSAHHPDRPTWKREGKAFTPDALRDKVRRNFADYLAQGGDPYGAATPHFPPPDRKTQKALSVLDLPWPVTAAEVKAKFTLLVKELHPDVNRSKEAEERFKIVTESYQFLRKSLSGAVTG